MGLSIHVYILMDTTPVVVLLYMYLKKKTGKESQYIVSRPELGSDLPIGSDQESGCDNQNLVLQIAQYLQVVNQRSSTRGGKE